jgi:mercuric ion transport protein
VSEPQDSATPFWLETRREKPVSESQGGRGALAAGGLAAILASTCCLGPLVLVALGVSGAWIGNLTLLEPYRPIFIGAALAALFFAHRRIFRPMQACQPGEVCAVPQVRGTYKIIFWIVAALVAVALVFPYVLPLFY